MFLDMIGDRIERVCSLAQNAVTEAKLLLIYVQST
jgi:hypothetical protein